MAVASWTSVIDLQTPAGQLLHKLAAGLPQDRHFEITVFGSAPIQITVDPSLSSADVDVFSDFDELRQCVEKAGLDKDKVDFYVQVSSELNFRTSPRWKNRTQSARIGNCTFLLPHPIDIL